MDDLLAPPGPDAARGFRPVPGDDPAFEAAIREAAAVCLDAGFADLPACMTERLRIRYPNCVVRRQDELAAFAGMPPLIYVYRDG